MGRRGDEMDRLIVVSGDSHATVPPEVWPRVPRGRVPRPSCRRCTRTTRGTRELLGLFANFSPETPGGDRHRRGVGVRAGTSAPGTPTCVWPRWIARGRGRDGVRRAIRGRSCRSARSSDRYPQDVVAAGVRAYHRWAADAFGEANDRILVVGDPASGVDLDAMVAELAVDRRSRLRRDVRARVLGPSRPAPAVRPVLRPVLVAM